VVHSQLRLRICSRVNISLTFPRYLNAIINFHGSEDSHSSLVGCDSPVGGAGTKCHTTCTVCVLTSKNVKVKKSLCRPWGFQEAEVPRIQHDRHMKVVKLSALRIGRLYTSGDIPSTHFCYRLSRHQGQITDGSIMSMAQSEIKPATFRLVERCLNQLRHRVSFLEG